MLVKPSTRQRLALRKRRYSRWLARGNLQRQDARRPSD